MIFALANSVRWRRKTVWLSVFRENGLDEGIEVDSRFWILEFILASHD